LTPWTEGAVRRRSSVRPSRDPGFSWICDDRPDRVRLNPEARPGGRELRILIVEDELAIADAVKVALGADGHAADIISNGLQALDWAATYAYDLVILDVILPGLDGFATCSALREAGFSAPILMLTALDDVQDRVTGLDRGADDYLAKPFSMDELRARVRALGRRRIEDRTPRIVVGDLELDPATLGVWRAGRTIRLTAREFALLELLARHPGQVFARDRLIDALWDADFVAESNIVEVYIRSLRRKVDEGRRDGLIETVRGSGYRLRAGGAP
jgi:two-component system OmpR family response regulator